MSGNKTATLENIKVELLKVDESYQKKPYITRIEKMVKNFDPNIVGELTVSKRMDGSFYIIDGQHRCAALKRKGFKTARCVVYQGWDVEEEAYLYNGLGDRSQQKPNEKFKVDLLLGVQYAVEIHDAVRKNGLDICFDRSGRGLKCGATLKAVYKKYGVSVLETALQLINGCFPGREDAFVKHVITGYCMFVAEFGKSMEKKRLTNKIHKIGFEAFNVKVNLFSARGAEKGVREAILHFYNYQSREKIGEI